VRRQVVAPLGRGDSEREGGGQQAVPILDTLLPLAYQCRRAAVNRRRELSHLE